MVLFEGVLGRDQPDNLQRRLILLVLLLGLLAISEAFYFATHSPLDALISHFTFGIINRYSKCPSLSLNPTSMKSNYLQVKYNVDQLNECPAKEVYQSYDRKGQYGFGTQPRVPRNKKLRFRVGNVVKHRKYGYRGVIVGYDESCKASHMWRMAMHKEDAARALDTPHYAVLVDTRNRPHEQQTYVAEWNLAHDMHTVKHSKVLDYYDRYDSGANRYVMRPALKHLYLED